jgi:pimeloyl-ACP methyl ester carboxylesterase
MSAEVRPFRVETPEEALQDLRDRLARTRWPEAETVGDWSQGVPLSYAKELCEYWLHKYDWRATEARLNSFPQYRTDFDGLGIHFIHVRSKHEHALPLLITHGWPGSVVEQLDVIDALADPDDPADAFHVVVPSLPGYGFSERPVTTGWDIPKIADTWAELMTRLGYDRFAAHGGDWGSYTTATLAIRHPERLTGIHLTMPVAPKPEEPVELDEADQARLGVAYSMWKNGSGYAAIQSTRPQTLGYGLADSPAAQAAWVAEKFWEWADHDGDLDQAIPRDRLLDSVTGHWLAGTGASSARLYWESYQKVPVDQVHVPTGCSIFPKNSWVPRAWCEKRFTDLRYWRDLAEGGHFPAVEQPGVLIDELREFFRGLR